MNLHERLVDAVCKELIDTRFYEYVPSNSNPRRVELQDDNTFGIGAEDLTEWQMSFNEELQQFYITIYRDRQIIGKLTLTSDGIWKGRSRENNGTVLLRPQPSGANRWKLLAHPIKYGKSITMDEKEETFTYKEPLSRQFDWTPYEWNLKDYVRDSVIKEHQTAIALIIYDRLPYFQQTVQSLAQNPEAHTFPVFAFFDKPEDDKGDIVNKQIDILKKYIPKAYVVKRPRNFGCGRNIIDARRQLFDNLGFRRIFIFEDDMVVTSNYIKMTLNLFNWADAHYSNIGAVQGWGWCDFNQAKRKAYNKVVKPTYTNWWGYCMSLRAWESMREEMYKFEELFLGGAYRFRPHESIKSWFRLKIRKPLDLVGTKSFRVRGAAIEHERNNYFNAPPTGQDAATMHLFERHGWVRLCTQVNRGKYIGKYGIHSTPRLWLNQGFDRILFEEYSSDSTLKDFSFEPEEIVEDSDAGKGEEGFSYVNKVGV